jgi:lipopolysaccharide assembly protein A
MRILSWLIRAFIFFTLFAFALNNQHPASVHWFFGVEWRAPMVFVVLAAFAAGCALGAAAMLPGWWKGRKWMNGDFGASAPTASGPATQPGPPAAAAGTQPGPARPASSAAASGFGNDQTSGLGV